MGGDRRGSAAKEQAIARGLDRLREVLRARNLKMSSVREAIARAALAYEGHFRVDDLVRYLHASGVREAHMATVYRSLPLMIEAGLIQPALVPNGDGQVYEASFERERHDHLRCTGCGLVVEYKSETLEALQREIAARHGFELEEQVHELRGRCRKCRRAGASTPPPGSRRSRARTAERSPR